MERTFELRCTAFVIGVALPLYLSSVTSAPVKAPVPNADPKEHVADPNDVEVRIYNTLFFIRGPVDFF